MNHIITKFCALISLSHYFLNAALDFWTILYCIEEIKKIQHTYSEFAELQSWVLWAYPGRLHYTFLIHKIQHLKESHNFIGQGHWFQHAYWKQERKNKIQAFINFWGFSICIEGLMIRSCQGGGNHSGIFTWRQNSDYSKSLTIYLWS